MARNRPWGLILGVLLIGAVGCTKKPPPPPPNEIGLYSGIKEVLLLGDSLENVRRRIKEEPARDLSSMDATLKKLNFTDVYYFKNSGLTAYFRYRRVALIEMQAPFRGTIKGNQLTFFEFGAKPEGMSWENVLMREFGQPQARAAGGRFGAEALFYNWGDVSYNNMGPNQIALYRDPELQNYRLNNFGRSLRLFKN